ncbi:MAG: FadR family transcriptional regulator [Afipia sp.]|nr:FadR family transcriptional regulator [Afipia sp.]OJW63931.1 MAG: hypothetical protein BGO65_04745 [Afipia sp. 64-13]
MNYTRVRRSKTDNLTDKTTAALREEIITGKYPPGRQLPSGRELSEAFGVSITVVREALSRLKSDGLITSHQGKGVFVEDDTKARPFRLESIGKQSSISDIFELRIAIEVQGSMLAAERRSAADLRDMARCLKEMRPGQNSFDKAHTADINFHLSIARATKNPLIVSFMEFLQPHLYEAIWQARQVSSKQQQTKAISYDDHFAIYKAIEASDPQQAQTSMLRVLQGSLSRLTRKD